MMETSVITAPLASKDTFSGAINLTSTCVLGNENARSPRVLDRLPVYDLGAYLRGEPADETAVAIARCLSETGCLVIRDFRVNTADNEAFLNMMERYFEQPTEVKLLDARPSCHYQVGVTPEGIEVPRCTMDPDCAATVSQQPLEHRATLPTGPDPKWRYFWRLGSRNEGTAYEELNTEPNVLPAGFPEWQDAMDRWGNKMLAALHTTSELLAMGLGLSKDAITSLMDKGPHLLGPTGVDLGHHTQAKQSFAGFHYDLNLLTIHGKSRFPGLYIWLADGRRIPVRIPDGCLLLQAGKQLEWLTAGHIKAGMHEVICSKETRAAAEAAKAKGQSMWRVSSTVFGHVASHQILRPLGDHFPALPSAARYPAMTAGDYVEQELSVIALKAPVGPLTA